MIPLMNPMTSKKMTWIEANIPRKRGENHGFKLAWLVTMRQFIELAIHT